MIIYPAIDLKDGQCVRLVQGRVEDKTVYSNSPAEVARSFEEQGAEFLHVVDLDGAFEGSPRNLTAIAKIADEIHIPFQVGGGLRSLSDVKRVLGAGAARVIIGTRAVNNPDFMKELLDQFGPEKVVLGLDARNGMVALEGWVNTSSLSAVEFGVTMKNMGVKTAIYTDISRDGLLSGPNLSSTRRIAVETGLKVIASGGVSSRQDVIQIKELEPLGVTGAIIGKALYDGKLSLEEALQAGQ
ncbi:1-(5-phosphoribosyl)-5-[(5-phosphoribosylamino)methylideneamino]imidazole-4-carboxamide isomerase [Syntrophomonas erecta]